MQKVQQSRKGREKFYFLDGPPYTSGYIHLGTAWNKVLKDVVIRFFTMKGYDVWRQSGWDMHGLPIEVGVEQELGFKSKKDIEAFGIENFIRRCKEFALRNLKIMEKQFQRIGVWMDWDNPYMTITRDWIESEWWTFKKAWEQGLIDTDLRVVHWCPRCETALAEHEIEYKVLEDPSIYVKFPLEGRENDFVVIWTTTPWTLPANMAALVHPDYDYAKVKVTIDGKTEYWYLAEARVQPVMDEIGVEHFEIIEVVKGSELEGIRYVHILIDEYPRQKEFREKYPSAHRIVTGEFVTLEEGTGCVHIAPGHGEEDFEIGKRYNLPVYCPVDKSGIYTEGAWKDWFVKKADEQIINRLKEKGLLVASGRVTHKYPTCWRCKSPLLFRATRQWFLKVSLIKNKIIQRNHEYVEWLPSWVKKRYEDGVRNVGDWVISRQRYWNTPIPLWICRNCGYSEVIGSFSELKQKAIDDIPDDMDLHRPWIDQVKLRCSKCGGEMERVPDVLDVWFDSAIASWASLGYPTRKDLFNKLWPADLIIEGQDQILKWFYAQQVLSIIVFDKPPYRKVAMHGFVLDAAGSKMSKSLGNIVMPEDVIEKHGADALRMYLLSTTLPWEDIRFEWKEVEEVRSALDILWNVFYMVSVYMELDKFNLSKVDEESVKNYLLPEDKWLLSRVNSLLRTVEDSINTFQLAKGVRAAIQFIVEDLSRWYGKLVRKRFWIEKEDPVKLAAYYTMYHVFYKLLAVLALFAPYVAEEIYQSLIRPLNKNVPESVHLIEWPEIDFVDKELEEKMEVVRDLVSAVAAARNEAKIKLRWPIKRVIIETKDDIVKIAVNELRDIVVELTNAKKIEFAEVEKKWRVVPLMKALGPKFRTDASRIAAALEKIDGKKLKEEIERSGKYILRIDDKKFEITPEDFDIELIVPDKLVPFEFRKGYVYVDTEITDDLLAEAYSRELVRRIQQMRKELDLDIEEKIDVYLELPEEMRGLISRGLDYISNEVRANKIHFGEPRGYVKKWKIEKYEVNIGIVRLK